MNNNQNGKNTAILDITGRVVTAFLTNPNANVASADVPGLIESVHNKLMNMSGDVSIERVETHSLSEGPLLINGTTYHFTKPQTTAVPAVPLEQSVTNDHIICLDDGAKLRTMTRHLGVLGMTPEQYRTKWGLPDDYPMSAKSFLDERRAFAKKIGLGGKVVRKKNAKKPGPKAKIKK